MKRFIDTEMVLCPWFRALPPRLKCLWLFMFCRCDMSGILKMDWGLASFAIGEDVSTADLSQFDGNAVIMPDGRIYLPKFVRFQYGELNPQSKVHQGVIRCIEHHGESYPTDSLYMGHDGLSIGHDGTKEKVKVKDKVEVKIEGGCKGETDPSPLWTLDHVIQTGSKPTVGMTERDCREYYDMRNSAGWVDQGGRAKARTQSQLESDMRHCKVSILPGMRSDRERKENGGEKRGLKDFSGVKL